MEEDKVTVTMTKEQYEDMIYCMTLVRKQREKASRQYYMKKRNNEALTRHTTKRKQHIPIPTI